MKLRLWLIASLTAALTVPVFADKRGDAKARVEFGAIGYEQLGRFDEARKAYEKALELEPGNNFIHTNYAQFREIYDRLNYRRGK